ncbi:MAG: hypothetical protein V4671_04330, partial [Armatimonadota bacterium]
MATVFNLLTTQVPPVQSVSGMQSIADAKASSAGTANTSANFSPGEKSLFRGKLNENALRMELGARYASSAIFYVAVGLTITATPTTATVSAGQAGIGGLVELTSSTDVDLSVGLNRIWLMRDKTVTVTLNSV